MATKPNTVGRRLANISAMARGRTPFRYEFEIIPYCVAEVPLGHERVLFVWERGTKLFVTDPEVVNPKTQVVFWKQYLRQTITVYRAGSGIVKKEYTFKVQSVKESADGEQERTTIGKAQIDLSVYCTGQIDPPPQELFLQLKPHGKLKVSIKAAWLKDAKIDPDAMTEVSGSVADHAEEAGQYFEEDPYNEQDLTGFDPADNGRTSTSGRHHHHRSSRTRDVGKGRAADDSSGGGGENGVVEENGNGHHHASRKGGGGGRGRPKAHGRGDDGDGEQYESECKQLSREPDDMRRIQEEVDDEHADCQQEDAEEYDRMVAEITAQVRTEVEPVQSGAVFCCCFKSKHKISVDVQEVASLLNKQQGRQMSHSRQI